VIAAREVHQLELGVNFDDFAQKQADVEPVRFVDQDVYLVETFSCGIG